MANDKIRENPEGHVGDSAVRARNKTMMLTPEITGKVRARLSRESEMEERRPALPEQGDQIELSDRVVENYSDQGISGRAAQNGMRASAGIPSPHSREEENQRVAPQRRPLAQESQHTRGEDAFTNFIGGDVLHWAKKTRVVGFLVSFDKEPEGQVIVLRSGRLIVTSEVPNGGSYLLLASETVSESHAILKISEDLQIQVLDNLSESGTTIIRRESGEKVTLAGDKAMVVHGDVLLFGERSFTICTIG